MILVDYSKLAIAACMQALKGTDYNTDLARHFILNSLRHLNHKFKDEYGELVIACDGGKYWRRDVFPYYKAKRAEAREASMIDWEKMFEAMNTVREEAKDFLPYRVIHISGVEADDIIAVLSKEYGNGMERVLIVASDGDFDQLNQYIGVQQYCSTKRKIISSKNPEAALFEKIIRGDKKDGIPNIKSDDDTFMIKGKRQKTISAKYIEEARAAKRQGLWPTEDVKRNWDRNQLLIDFDYIPENIETLILETFAKTPKGDKSKLLDYMFAHKLKNLVDKFNEF